MMERHHFHYSRDISPLGKASLSVAAPGGQLGGSPDASPEPSEMLGPGLTQEEEPSTTSKYPDYCRTLQVRDSNGAVKELVFPKALDLDRPKRARTTFSAEQLYKLEREFQRNQYLVGRERTDLAATLQLSETQVKVWFQNRRTKYKRDNCRQADERKQHAEGLAACNILRMLQQNSPPSSASGPTPAVPPPPPPAVRTQPPAVLPPIPIALSITNRPAMASPVLQQTAFGQTPFAQTPPRLHFPPPPHLVHAHRFASGFYTS